MQNDVRHLLVAGIVLVSAFAASARAQALPKSPAAVAVRVTLQVDTATRVVFDARAFDLVVSPGTSASGAEVQLVKSAGPQTGALVQMSANATRTPLAMIEVLDSTGAPRMTFRLSDVSFLSDRITVSSALAGLEQQRIAQQEALSSLTADFQEAQRQLAMLEELGKTRVATRQDVARAHDRATDLQRRIDLLKQRQALLANEMAGHGPLDETLVLHFGRLDVESRSPSPP